MTDRNKKPQKKQKPKNATQRSLEIIAMRDDETDPFGSYTGTGEDISEVPVQDQDDL